MKSPHIKPTLFILAAVAVLTVSFIFGFGTAHLSQAEEAEKAEAAPSAAADILKLTDKDYVLGSADAPVTIIEYSSMSCPHCAAFHTGLFQEIKRKYIETGVVKFANRHYPLNEPALRAGMLTLCAGQERGITFTDVLFQMQEKWAYSADFLANLKKIAAVGGIDAKAFDACMNNKDIETKLLETRKQAAEVLKVQATPTFYVNGEELKADLSIEKFDKAIAKAQEKEAPETKKSKAE